MANPFSLVWNGYLRWRHSKGYGVHSPFAYRLVNDVIRPGDYGFYAYHEIDRRFNGGGKDLFDLKFVLRLLVFLEIKRIVVKSEDIRPFQIVGKSIGIPVISAKGNPDFRKGDLLITQGEMADLKPVEDAIGSCVPVLARKPSRRLRELLETPIERGLLMTGKNSILLVPRANMAYTSYKINFK